MTKKKTEDKKVDTLEQTREIISKLLEHTGTSAKIDLSEDKESDAIKVNIEAGEETGLIIGNRGRTLASIQMIVGMILKRKLGEWKRVVIDVSNWREKEEQRLKNLAEQVAERVRQTGEPQRLYNLTSSQRRMIHLALSDDTSVKTESEGEGKERFLVVSPI